MIKVIDSIMGSGKTTWAIRYMNTHPDEHFIYVTPFLDEVTRIKIGCAGIGMTEPSNEAWTKTNDIKTLIYNNKNVATTHAMLARISVDAEFREHLRLNHYHLILDETIEVLTEVGRLKRGDVNLILKDLAEVDETTRLVRWTADEDYVIERYADVKAMAEAGTLVLMKNKMFMWLMPIKLIEAVPSITIMTYLFEGSHLAYYLRANNQPYLIQHIENGELVDGLQDLTAFKAGLREKLHIYDGPLNDIGNGQYTLSASWWQRHTANKKVANNTYNFFRHVHDAKSNETAWSAFKSAKLQINGYQKCSLPFNERAKNSYAGKHYAAYLVNVFEHPSVTEWFSPEQVDQDAYALSTLLQWIWRFAIRNGEDTYLYIPSERMRKLLIDWLNDC